jgi:hypothetical protein
MKYIDLPETDDPVLLKLELDILKSNAKYLKEERKVGLIIFILIMAFIIFFGIWFELALFCSIYGIGGGLCAL